MSGKKNIAKQESLGEKLKRIRKQKGFTLQEVHNATKIHEKVLKQLEADDTENMASAYVRGLLKIYCKFLGIDISHIAQDRVKQTDRQEDKKDKLDISQKENPQDPGVLHPATSAEPVDIKVKLRTNKYFLRPQQIIIVLCVVSLLLVLHNRQRLNPQTADIDLPRQKQETRSQEMSPSKSIGNSPVLGIFAKENCWLEVKVDNKTVFKGILKKGKFEQWQAKELIQFSLGNAGGVKVEVNNRVFSPLGRRGQVIKNIKITKQGLMVPE